MRIVHVYLRGNKFFAVGKSGSGVIYIESTPPFVSDTTVDSVTQAITAALESSKIPLDVSEVPYTGSGLPLAAGVKNEAAFRKGTTMGMLREQDDKVELLLGEKSQGGWHARVVRDLPRSTPPRDIASAMLAILGGEVEAE
jgi:hypothetical protein